MPVSQQMLEIPPQVSKLDSRVRGLEAAAQLASKSIADIEARLSVSEVCIAGTPTPKEANVALPLAECGRQDQALFPELEELDTAKALSDASTWMQAEAVLRLVGDVVARQQRELASLTAGLNLQCSSIAIEEGPTPLDHAAGADHSSRAVTANGIMPGSPAACARTPERDSHSRSRVRTVRSRGRGVRGVEDEDAKASRASSRGSSQAEEATATDELRLPGLRASGPWSALSHLSAALTGFEAVLHRAESSGALGSDGAEEAPHGRGAGCRNGSQGASGRPRRRAVGRQQSVDQLVRRAALADSP